MDELRQLLDQNQDDRLDPATGHRSAEDEKIYSPARRRSRGAVDAAFVTRSGDHAHDVKHDGRSTLRTQPLGRTDNEWSVAL